MDAVLDELNVIPARPLDARDRRINHRAWVRLWTLATGAEHYDKAKWIAVEEQLRLADLL